MTSELAGARTQLKTGDGRLALYSLPWLAEAGIGDVSVLPHTVKILLVRHISAASAPKQVLEQDFQAVGELVGAFHRG